MGNASQASLGNLRLAAQERADLETNSAVSTEAWNQLITQSYKELYDMLISAYGNDYYIANVYQFTTTNTQSYALPDGTSSYLDTIGSVAPKFYKLLGVDLQYSGSPNGWLTLRNYNMIDRNKYAMPNTQTTWAGYTNLRYKLQGNSLYLTPTPQTGQTVQVWYAPAPTNLQYRLQGSNTVSSTVSFSDTVGLSVGMNITGPGIPSSTTLASVGTGSAFISQNATAANTNAIFSMWTDSTLIEGISGWEEYIIVDAAIKAKVKLEEDPSALMAAKLELKQRIEAMAEGRDAGQAFHVSDVLGANGVWGGDGDFGDGFGGSGAW